MNLKLPLLNGLNFAVFGFAFSYIITYLQNKFVQETTSLGLSMTPLIWDPNLFIVVVILVAFVLGFLIGLLVELIYYLLTLPFKIGKKNRKKI